MPVAEWPPWLGRRNRAESATSPPSKIQLGLSCKYACEYCSQRFVPHAAETNKDDVEPFLAGLAGWIKVPPERIEFWGANRSSIGNLKPLAEALRDRFLVRPSAS